MFDLSSLLDKTIQIVFLFIYVVFHHAIRNDIESVDGCAPQKVISFNYILNILILFDAKLYFNMHTYSRMPVIVRRAFKNVCR